MKNLKLCAFAFMVILFTTIVSYAQEGTFSYHFGAAIPAGNFADDDIDDFMDGSGGAGLGLNFGLQYVYPLSENGLGLFAGVDINYNPLSKDVRDDFDDEYEYEEDDIDVKYPKYLNIPVTAGLHYTLNVNEKVSLYGKGGLAASFFKMTKWKESGSDYEDIEKYDLSTGFGYTIGGGIILNDKIEIGLTYLGLGEHEFDGEYEYEDDFNSDEGDIDDLKTDVALTTLTIGFKF